MPNWASLAGMVQLERHLALLFFFMLAQLVPVACANDLDL